MLSSTSASASSSRTRAKAELARLLEEKERRRCKRDPLHFIRRHVRVELKDGTPVPFRLWPCQEETIRALHEHGQVIVLKARQLGLSWTVLAYALWLAIFQQGIRVVILCKKDADAKKLLARIRRMLDRLATDRDHAYLVAGLTGGRDSSEQLEIGRSTILSVVGKADSIRSEAAGLVVLDEFAFALPGEAEGIWRAALPAAERLAVISTGNGPAEVPGQGQEFARQWNRAVSGESGLVPLFFPWHAHPGRDEEWRRSEEARIGDPDRFRVEYPTTPDDAFQRPDVLLVFSPQGINAAEALGRRYDELREAGELPEPEYMAAGIDFGDFATHAVPVWPLERGGIYIPPGEIAATQADVEDITERILESVLAYPYWFAEARYDAAFKQSARTFARVAEQRLGPHNPIRRTGRPNTVPVPFGKWKSLCISYLRALLRRTAQGETTRVIAISPKNTVLLAQLRSYTQDDLGRIEKGGDDAVDALIAGVQPVARRHRESVEEATG